MPNEQFIPLAPLLIALGAMLAVAVAVERFMLIFNWIIHRLLIMQAPADEETKVQHKEAIARAMISKDEDEYLRLSTDKLPDEPLSYNDIGLSPVAPSTESGFDIKPLDPPEKRVVYKEFWIQLVASFVAITGCYLAKFSIWPLITLPHRWSQGLNSIDFQTTASQPWEYILTGIIIGAGTKPVYFLMNFLINRKVTVTRQETLEHADTAPVTERSKPDILLPKKSGKVPEPLTLEEIIGFSYDGGNRPDRIEHSHHRKDPLDLIVYHHTAMHSDSPFEEVVKEFDRKGWMTGYHCVVTKSGEINVLTRWDRIGSHARGNNYRSLGIALHGNFETTPGVPGSNADGKLGAFFPTTAQVDAAAKIVVMWALLYGIKIDFKNSIIPHNALQSTACPGNNFPHEIFQKLIKEYASRWRQNQQVKKALERFKSSPMVTA